LSIRGRTEPLGDVPAPDDQPDREIERVALNIDRDPVKYLGDRLGPVYVAIRDGKAEGKEMRAIARSLGVHPATISNYLAAIRSRVRELADDLAA